MNRKRRLDVEKKTALLSDYYGAKQIAACGNILLIGGDNMGVFLFLVFLTIAILSFFLISPLLLILVIPCLIYRFFFCSPPE